MAIKAPVEVDISSALREQLTLVTFVILFAGLVATDTYYAGFGIRFQLLDLAMPFLVYRGLTAAFSSIVLIVIYALTIAWLSYGAVQLASSAKAAVRGSVQPVTYALILLIVVATYFAAVSAGRTAAVRDQTARYSQLPVVQSLAAADGRPLDFQGSRVLFAGKDSVVLFKATNGPSEVPFMHILKRDDVGEITISR